MPADSQLAFVWDGQPNTVRCNVPPADFVSNTFHFSETPAGYLLQVQTPSGPVNCERGEQVYRFKHQYFVKP